MDRINQIIGNTEFKNRLAVLSLLEKDRPFCKHDITHFLDVARIMTIYAHNQGLNFSHDIIYATALLHDLGRIEQYLENIPHEIAGVDIAKKILMDCGFENFEIDAILKAILMHRDSSVVDDLAGLLYFADKKSRTCFTCSSIADCNWPDAKKNMTLEF